MCRVFIQIPTLPNRPSPRVHSHKSPSTLPFPLIPTPPMSAAASKTALAALAAAVAISAALALLSRRRLAARVRDLEASLDAAAEKLAAERRGRVRAQQALRKALSQQSEVPSGDDGLRPATVVSYPMRPIGVVRSCFTTRNGTPRQPVLVPLARARLVFDPRRVPLQALEGLAEYSHVWVLYVFHLNTDLDKIWKPPSQSKFKAKVRVPRLKGGKLGALATRSPHRPCPIGLSVAKVEEFDGHSILLSGVDIVDGAPILDIKPYLPYTDSIQGATVPKWLETEDTLAVASVSFSPDFASTLSSCWNTAEKNSLYATAEEFQRLTKEVLSWDIRSMRSLRNRIQPSMLAMEDESQGEPNPVEGLNNERDKEEDSVLTSSDSTVAYHLILEGIVISYRMDSGCNIIVEKASIDTFGKTSLETN